MILLGVLGTQEILITLILWFIISILIGSIVKNRTIGFSGGFLITVIALGFYVHYQDKPDYYNAATDRIYSNPSNIEKTAAEMSTDLELKEQSDPLKYFQLMDIDNHPNLLGEQVLKGTIVCTSDVAKFKDVIIEASYYSESNTLLGKEQFTRYEIWIPSSRLTYKFKTTPPAHTRKVYVEIVRAVPTE
jgi:hypothetical protein